MIDKELEQKSIDHALEYHDALQAETSFVAGAQFERSRWMPIIEEMKTLLLSQPRYTVNDDEELVELYSWKKMIKNLRNIEEKLEKMKCHDEK